ncbi:hypothetical protein B0H17DRAFT_1325730 [Mycena rosella]|uniref:Uncharacterized protein n=1 Tax=Mycena rosella TaxID=1033263 RepID=A0AAD7GX37_MYCRO|nr:hypothetical protein B0H17DRAFT_1325730 [Mycena rosella]
MPSNIILFLNFLMFILGQLFQAFCHSLSSPTRIVSESATRLVSSGPSFSLSTVIVMVIAVLFVHDALILLVLRHILLPKHAAKTRSRRAFPMVADRTQDALHMALVLFVRPRIRIPASIRYAFRTRWLAFSIPRLLRDISYRPAVTFIALVHTRASLLEYSTAMVLFVNKNPSLLSCPLAHDGCSEPQDDSRRLYYLHLFLLRLRLFIAVVAASRMHQHEHEEPCYATIEEVPDDEEVECIEENEDELDRCLWSSRVFYAPSLSYLLSAHRRRPQVVPLARPSHLHLLRHLFVPRTRRLEAQDDINTLVVAVAPGLSIEEAKNDIKITKVTYIEENVGESVAAKATEDQKADTLVVEAEKNVKEETIEEKEIEKNVEVEENIELLAVPQEPPPTYDWDRAPSYEEFASGAPPEPLFAERPASPTHAVHRPPSLATVAARTGATPSSSGARASRIPLLARLSSRLGTISVSA